MVPPVAVSITLAAGAGGDNAAEALAVTVSIRMVTGCVFTAIGIRGALTDTL